jgi:DNA-binding NarL/FixJ family response regulator
MVEGTSTIDVAIADDQEIFRIGIAEVLATAADIRVIGQAECPEQLLKALETISPHVMILSTGFLPAFSEIQQYLNRWRSALLVLTEENDHIAYVRWLGARGVVSRSIDGAVMAEAVRRVARGDLFVPDGSASLHTLDHSEHECSICCCEIDSDCEELRRNIAAHVILHAAHTVVRRKQ